MVFLCVTHEHTARTNSTKPRPRHVTSTRVREKKQNRRVQSHTTHYTQTRHTFDDIGIYSFSRCCRSAQRAVSYGSIPSNNGICLNKIFMQSIIWWYYRNFHCFIQHKLHAHTAPREHITSHWRECEGMIFLKKRSAINRSTLSEEQNSISIKQF